MKIRPEPGQITDPLHVARQAALVGGATAIPGTIIGAFYGTLRTKTPVLFSITSGAQCFAIGAAFTCARTVILNRYGLANSWNITRGKPITPVEQPTSQDRIFASTVAGTFTGVSLGLLFRGPQNVIPGAIMFSLFGWGGQLGYDYLDRENTKKIQEQAMPKTEEQRAKENETFFQRIAKSKYSPVSVLTDGQYIERLNEQVLSLETEIALVDDKIEGLRTKQKELEMVEAQKEKGNAKIEKK
ncbi:hypothetical protein BDV96DRAFT_579596 [Lophiotrema nucula]|uniref:Uncharacterized protein n=1 Tax=Lophiotrema nucula TaxID=690887 RepID=A0A6A5Z3M8_9PLEO|nr:hypothetical protein BDV96DRAFT_579596 [Lophiotrema nucula]